MFVVTLKPGRMNRGIINFLKERGIENFRVNFARNEVVENLDLVNELKENKGIVFADLPGEKLRLNYISNVRILCEGDTLTLKNGEQGINSNCAAISNNAFFEAIEKGDIVTIGDSKAQFVVDKVLDQNEVVLVCIRGGKVYNKAGVLIQEKYVSSAHLCATDISIIKRMNCQQLDFMCVSFADRSSLVEEAKRLIPTNASVKVTAKIESPIGVNNLEEIISCSDGILLARNDLSNFYTVEQLAGLAEQFKKRVSKDKVLIFASNYLRASIQNGALDEREVYYLKHDLGLEPDYIYINETYYCKKIEDAIEMYQSIATGR